MKRKTEWNGIEKQLKAESNADEGNVDGGNDSSGGDSGGGSCVGVLTPTAMATTNDGWGWCQ